MLLNDVLGIGCITGCLRFIRTRCARVEAFLLDDVDDSEVEVE